MKLLLSWSKMRSKSVAEALYTWLPTVVPGIEPWMSTKDIAKGLDWERELQGILEETRICLICVTPENVRSPWLYYEAGAVAGKGPEVLIYPYLVDLAPNMLADGPLGKRQCTIADRDDTWALIKSLNEKALQSKNDPLLLEGNFQTKWPDFGERIKSIAEAEPTDKEDFIETEADELARFPLSSEGRAMLTAMAEAQDGQLMYGSMKSGKPQSETFFQVNRKNLCQDQSPRAVAMWKSVLDDLVNHGLLQLRGQGGGMSTFALTSMGYKVADQLKEEK